MPSGLTGNAHVHAEKERKRKREKAIKSCCCCCCCAFHKLLLLLLLLLSQLTCHPLQALLNLPAAKQLRTIHTGSGTDRQA
jgi:hypothetical protein